MHRIGNAWIGTRVVRILPGRNGQLVVLAATRLDAPPDALVTWTRAIADLKRSTFVKAVGRFSDPPELADLDGLTLDERDVRAIRECEPGECAVKQIFATHYTDGALGLTMVLRDASNGVQLRIHRLLGSG